MKRGGLDSHYGHLCLGKLTVSSGLPSPYSKHTTDGCGSKKTCFVAAAEEAEEG
jgi:hypothetical protein